MENRRMENIGVGRTDLRSSVSHERSYCTFFNCTQRKIDVIWMDFTSNPVLYRSITPRAGFQIDTFKTHPWIFKDTTTGEQMQVNHCDVFWPEASVIDSSTNELRRFRVIVHFPMRTLQENAAWKVLEFCTSESILDKLEIPIKLINDLKLKLKIRNLMVK